MKAVAIDSSDAMSIESASAVEVLFGESSSSLRMASLARLSSPRHPMRIWLGSGRAKRAFAISNPIMC